MRKWLLMFLLMSCAYANKVMAEETLRYALFPAPPFMIYGEQQMSGIDVEIVNEIAAQLHLKVEYIQCPWMRCLELMKTGKADLLSSAYKKPEREEFMQYFSTPFLNQLKIYTRLKISASCAARGILSNLIRIAG